MSKMLPANPEMSVTEKKNYASAYYNNIDWKKLASALGKQVIRCREVVYGSIIRRIVALRK